MIITQYDRIFDPGSRRKDTCRGTSATIGYQAKNVR